MVARVTVAIHEVASRRPWLSKTRSPAVCAERITCPPCCALFFTTANALVSPPKSADAYDLTRNSGALPPAGTVV
jgi:hypothetical protein